jgi:DNA replication and repair protein RecF
VIVEWLDLVDFRCHPELHFEPESGVNVLLGPNGAGKTSILEAIGYAGTLRSFRRTPDADLVRAGAGEAILRSAVRGDAGTREIAVSIPSSGRRRVLLNGKRPKANNELSDTLPLVAFLPDDLDLVKGGPGRRRDWLDELGARLSPETAAVQAEFSRSLRQRNTLLRQEGRGADPVTLSVWDERIASAGGRLTHRRLELIERLRPEVADAHERVAGEAMLSLRYRSHWRPSGEHEASALEAALMDALARRRGKDMEVRATTVGPHRDEPMAVLDERSARSQSSQGEQRSVALALRIAAYHLLESRVGRPPVLLLDDVFSELDVGRAEGVLELLPRGQVFVTSAREDEVPVVGRRWRVAPGRIE